MEMNPDSRLVKIGKWSDIYGLSIKTNPFRSLGKITKHKIRWVVLPWCNAVVPVLILMVEVTSQPNLTPRFSSHPVLVCSLLHCYKLYKYFSLFPRNG